MLSIKLFRWVIAAVLALLTGVAGHFLAWPSFVQNNVSKEDGSCKVLVLMDEAWKAAGGQLDSVYLEVTGESKEFLGSEKELETAAREMAKKAGITKAEISWKIERGLHKSVSLSGRASGGNAQIVLQSLEPAEGARGKTFVVAGCTVSDAASAVRVFAMLQAIIPDRIVKPEEAVVFQGSIKGVLSREEMMKAVRHSALRLRAKTYDPVDDISYWTVTGYSPLMPRLFAIGSDKVNLQWAFHANKAEGATKIYMGYPLIMTDY